MSLKFGASVSPTISLMDAFFVGIDTAISVAPPSAPQYPARLAISAPLAPRLGKLESFLVSLAALSNLTPLPTLEATPKGTPN